MCLYFFGIHPYFYGRRSQFSEVEMKTHSYSYQRDRDSHKLVSDMKIRQKLTIGFVGTSLLVGSLGCLALVVDKNTHAHIERINKKYIYEFEFSGRAIADIQAVNVATHKLSIGEIHIYSRGEIIALIESKLNTIENSKSRFVML